MVELAGRTEPALVTRAVAEAYGLHDRLTEWQVDDLVVAMGRDRMLLVLDDCEHLVDACASLVAELLRRTEHLTVLATSRQPLAVHGEHLLPVPPMTLPDVDAPLVPDATAFEAVSLFVERARAATGDFEVSAANVADVVGLCRRLDGVPLAIELAAARLRVLSLPQLVARLDDRFALLTGAPRAGTGRPRTLLSMVDWSYDLCTPAEQRAWSVLSVFEGGVELDAAEHVCGGPDGGGDTAGPSSALDLVSALVDKSVLSRDDDGSHVRYRMLETIRAYGLDRLAVSGEEPQVRRRHRDWFVGLAVQAAGEWFGPVQAFWVSRLRADEANLRAALHSAVEDGDADTALRLAVSLRAYWLGWESVEEGRRWLVTALALEDAPRPAEPALRVRGWLQLATMSVLHGDDEAARRALRAAADEAPCAAGLQARADGRRAQALAAGLDGDLARCAEVLASLVDDPVLRAVDPEAVAADLVALAETLTGLSRGAAGARRRAGRRPPVRGARRVLVPRRPARRVRHRAVAAGGATRTRRPPVARASRWPGRWTTRYGVLCALELLAWVASSTGDRDRAAVLFAALGPLWRSIGAPAGGSGRVRAHHEPARRRLVEAMGQRAYERASRRGASLSLDEAVTFCLGESARPAKRLEPPARRRADADAARARGRRAGGPRHDEPADRAGAGHLRAHGRGPRAADPRQAGVLVAGQDRVLARGGGRRRRAGQRTRRALSRVDSVGSARTQVDGRTRPDRRDLVDRARQCLGDHRLRAAQTASAQGPQVAPPPVQAAVGRPQPQAHQLAAAVGADGDRGVHRGRHVPERPRPHERPSEQERMAGVRARALVPRVQPAAHRRRHREQHAPVHGGPVALGEEAVRVLQGGPGGGQRQDQLVDADHPALPLAHGHRLERPPAVPGSVDGDGPGDGPDRLAAGAVAAVAACATRQRRGLHLAQVLGELGLEDGLDDEPGDLAQHALTPAAGVGVEAGDDGAGRQGGGGVRCGHGGRVGNRTGPRTAWNYA